MVHPHSPFLCGGNVHRSVALPFATCRLRTPQRALICRARTQLKCWRMRAENQKTETTVKSFLSFGVCTVLGYQMGKFTQNPLHHSWSPKWTMSHHLGPQRVDSHPSAILRIKRHLQRLAPALQNAAGAFELRSEPSSEMISREAKPHTSFSVIFHGAPGKGKHTVLHN